jgi:hypothetical protein
MRMNVRIVRAVRVVLSFESFSVVRIDLAKNGSNDSNDYYAVTATRSMEKTSITSPVFTSL